LNGLGHLTFDMPFPPLRNRHASLVRSDVFEWSARFTLPDGPRVASRMALDLLAAHAYPAAAPANLLLLTEWVTWAYQFNDHPPDEPHLAEMHDIVGGRQHYGSTPLAAALADLWNRTTTRRSEAWRAMFTAHVTDCLSSARQESIIMAFLDLSEISAGVDLPAEIRAMPAFAMLKKAAAHHVLAVNDIFFYRRTTADSANGYMRDYLSLERDTSVLGLQPYLAEIRATLRGNLTWCRLTSRYGEPVTSGRAARPVTARR
jgi:hypothetical protein